MSVVGHIHGSYVHTRRVRVLSRLIADLLPRDGRIIDIGCGDGAMAAAIMQLRPDVKIEGFDVLVREGAHIPVRPFDGRAIPLPDRSVDAVMFVDVLHHTDDPMVLLREASRVTDHTIVIKDHTQNGLLARPTLRFMDRVGNARHGVALPYNYWPKARWLDAFEELKLSVSHWESRLGLYPWPANWLFGRSLHFLAKLKPTHYLSGAPKPMEGES